MPKMLVIACRVLPNCLIYLILHILILYLFNRDNTGPKSVEQVRVKVRQFYKDHSPNYQAKQRSNAIGTQQKV